MLLPFIILETKGLLGSVLTPSKTLSYSIFIAQQLIIGISTAVLFSIIFIKALKKSYSKILSPAVLMLGVMLSYIVAQYINSSGIIAVITFAIIFSSTYVKGKDSIIEFIRSVETPARLTVFLLAGLLAWNIGLTIGIIIKTIAIFIILVCIRYLAAEITLNELSFGEKVFIALSLRKGAATAASILTLLFYNGGQMRSMLSIVLILIILSITSSKIAEASLEFLLGGSPLKIRRLDTEEI
jgi:NhaP-type Na+/H+ and K+/H+ antiporter